MDAVHPALQDRPIYLDYNATTPVDPGVVEAMLPFLVAEFGNPSSDHVYGHAAHRALEEARHQVSVLVGAPESGRIVFTGSGSEADGLAIGGTALANRRDRRRGHVITQATEHPAVLAVCAELRELHDVRVTVLPVDSAGLVDPADVIGAMTDETLLVSVMHANNETGTIQPVSEIARIAHERGALVHSDAAQTAGKIPIDVADLGIDLLTIVGHKMYAPKGIAALYIANDVALRPQISGGGQEGGLRAGTENVAYAVGLGHAAHLAHRALQADETDRLRVLRDHLHDRLTELLPDRVHVNGHLTHRLPNTLNVSIDGMRALTLLAELSDVAASAGSACHAGQDTPSPVLAAMGIPPDRALTAIRLSAGRWSTIDQAEQAATRIAATAS